jgi:propionate CoA-transferase
MPQGELVWLIEGQGHGLETLRSRTGVGTFLDPRCGTGSAVCSRDEDGFIRADGDCLEYRIPPIDCALFSAAAADADGNVYLTDMATLTETREAVRAARHNGGLVMAVVAGLCPDDPGAPRVEAGDVDAIVLNRWNEQAVMAPQSRPWRLFCPGGDGDDHGAIEKLRFVNRVLRITPVRGPVEMALGRLGATLFSQVVRPGAHVNIGVGYPEEVCREVYESGLRRDLVFTTETGVYGGLPAPGIYFGGAVNPERFESSAWMFHHYRQHLEAAVLGILEVDSAGNVNVSRRGQRISDYVGPGGFPTIVECARTVIFIGTWMAGADWRVEDGGLRLLRAGRPKFVDTVSEVTFNGARALADGKRVYYVTNVGVFRLGRQGLELIWLMPGVDLERDVVAHSGARFRVADPLRTVDPAVLTGSGFELRWNSGPGIAEA